MNLPDGIYFDLPEDDYHAIERCSPSALKLMRISPANFWQQSWLNPNPRELTPEQQERRELAKVLGRAYHCARLEPDAFDRRFIRRLDKADFADRADFVAGGTAYGDALGELKETKKKAGESVAEQAKRLADAGYQGPIWDIELAAWEAGRNGRQPIAAILWAEIKEDMARIAAVPEAVSLLSDGYAEVSILWTCPETGIPMKTRLDYLRTDGWAEFKTYANGSGKHVQQVISDAFTFNRYHVQAAVQREALAAIRAGNLEVHSSDDGQADLIDEIRLRPQEPRCSFIWQEKGGIPNLWVRHIQFHDVPIGATAHHAGASGEAQAAVEAGRRTEQLWFGRAKREVAAAKLAFTTYSAVYPEGTPWRPFDPEGTTSDADFRPHWLEEPVQ